MFSVFRPGYSGQRRTDFEENQTHSNPDWSCFLFEARFTPGFEGFLFKFKRNLGGDSSIQSLLNLKLYQSFLHNQENHQDFNLGGKSSIPKLLVQTLL
jgi:hypothetical protein